MAMGDLIVVKQAVTNVVNGQNVTTSGVAQDQKLSEVMAGATATTTQAGAVKQAAFQANSAAAPTQAEFNALLAKLIAAGIMAAS